MIAFGHSIIYDYQPSNQPNQELPSIIVQEGKTQTYDHHIDYDQNQNRKVSLSTDGAFIDNVSHQKWAFNIEDLVCFNWEKSSSILYYDLQPNIPFHLLEYWLLHTLLPIYLTIEGKNDLIHAGSVEIDKRAVLFIAPSFGGKSTLTNYFIGQGHPMISDDRVGLQNKNNKIHCTSSYPYHRPYRKMEDLGKKVEKFTSEDKELFCIYLLEGVDAKDNIDFTRLKGIDSFKALQYNFDFNLPLNKARSFELIGKIAAQVPIYKLSIPWDLERLSEVYDKVCQHCTQGTHL